MTTTTSATTTTLAAVLLPTATGADTNCPTTIPTANANTGSGWSPGYVQWLQTCPAGSNAHGYDVSAIAINIVSSPAGAHIRCSVYDAGTTHVAAGCDGVEATLTLNPAAYITMATTGACHLAPSVRYKLACATDSSSVLTGAGSGGSTSYASGVTYATLWPTTLTQGATIANSLAVYLTLTPTP